METLKEAEEEQSGGCCAEGVLAHTLLALDEEVWGGMLQV